MEKENKKKIIEISMILTSIILVLIVTAIIMFKYEVEGEQNMPFTLEKISIISTAEGVQKDTSESNKWNLSIEQNNDIYFSIGKNEQEKKDKKIEKLKIENIRIEEMPETGNIKIYMPNSIEGRVFQNSKEYEIIDKIIYNGSGKTDMKTLEIGNQGGVVGIRFAHTDFVDYISNEDTQITHDGTLLSKTGVTEEQLKFKISFELILQIDGKRYKTTIRLSLPCGDILEEGTTIKEETDTKEWIFKRMNYFE